MRLDFSDREVVVTGATGELGEAVARLLLSAGATVHVPARNADRARALYGDEPRARVVPASDLADEDAVRALYAGVPALWASIHCAGGFAMAAIDATALADLDRMLRMNALSSFLCTREAIRSMRGRGGRVVNVAARPGVEPRSGARMVAYAASKAAVAALTLAAAEEVASEGIWVNAVVPSVMDTEANRTSMPKADFSAWPKVDEVAATIAFLASPDNRATRAALVPVYGRS